LSDKTFTPVQAVGPTQTMDSNKLASNERRWRKMNNASNYSNANKTQIHNAEKQNTKKIE